MNTTNNADMVNRPPHYTGHPTGIEAITIIECNPYPNLGNVIKYTWRVSWGSKHDDIEDLKKVVWYAQREVARREALQAEKLLSEPSPTTTTTILYPSFSVGGFVPEESVSEKEYWAKKLSAKPPLSFYQNMTPAEEDTFRKTQEFTETTPETLSRRMQRTMDVTRGSLKK